MTMDWISVTNKLPNTGTPVIIRCRYVWKGEPQPWKTKEAELRESYFNERQDWWLANAGCGCCYDEFSGEVSHWMAMPDAHTAITSLESDNPNDTIPEYDKPDSSLTSYQRWTEENAYAEES